MRNAYVRALGAFGSLALSVALHGAEPPKAERQEPAPPLAGATLAPSLKAAAERDHVVLFHIDPADETSREGDTTVAWIGGRDAKSTRQWLVQFRRSTPTAAEIASNPYHDRTKYLSWGPVVTFKSDVQALDLWIAGPVVIGGKDIPGESAPVKRKRILVPSDFLRLGLDDSIRVDQHIHKRFELLRKEDPSFSAGHIYSLDKPIKPENVRYARPVAEKIGFTPETERAWIGGFVALEAFYNLANDVPEIEAIAAIAIEKPSVFKLVKVVTGTNFKTSFGGPYTRAIDPGKFGLLPVATEAFDAPFSFGFGKDLIVSGGMVVTKPQPPLDTTAGILALIASHPRDPNRKVQIVVITSARGEAAKR